LKGIVAFGLTRWAIVLLGLLVFVAGGLIAFKRLNIEAYPNPAPVVLEITAQAAGLSAEEMERYYTIPMEVGLYVTPGVANIRSTSFYGLSFVRVTFKYGTDYFFAYTQTALSLQQNVSLPGGVVPFIQQSSLVGEVYRYQIIGPPHFGLTNLRTVQDWIVARRLFTVPGVVAVNAWGGTTKQYDVDVDLNKLDAYNVTIPQIISALGNANSNVGGREITVGQQSVNIRGIGLFDSGGNSDLTQGWRVNDIENVVLTQSNGVPVQVKDLAKVSVGYVPRLGIAGKDRDDDVALAIVVMGRTYHANDVIPLIKDKIDKLNTDGSLPPGVKLVPYYDRATLISVTSQTVLHNLIYGCGLVFIIQWIFLGNLRSAIIVGANIPFALFFAVIIMVLTGQDANLLSVGAVDFGIIVDSAVILVENVFRNFQASATERETLLRQLADGRFGPDPTRPADPATAGAWTDRLRLILASALQVDKAIFFSALITVAAFVPLFTMQGVEGQIFSPMARTYGLALVGALLSTFTITPVLTSLLLPERVDEAETVFVRSLRRIYVPTLQWSLNHRKTMLIVGVLFLAFTGLLSLRLGSEFLPALEEGNLWIRASMPPTIGLEAGEPATHKTREILLRHPEVITVVSQHGRPDNGSDASPFSNVELFAPLKPYEQWRVGYTKDMLVDELQHEFNDELPGIDFNFSQYIQDNIEEALSGVKGANSVKIIGRDLPTIERIASDVMHEMQQVQAIVDLGIFHVLGQPNLNVKIDREKAARYGLNTGDVNTVIQAALAGTNATTLLEGDRQFSVVIRLPAEYRSSLEAVDKVKVALATTSGGANAYIPLNELANITLDTGASYIYHEEGERYIPVKFSVRDRDLGGAVAEAQRRIAQNVKLPSGYRLVWAGEFEDLENAKARLEVIVPISLLLILALLYALFNSLRDSLMALAGIPFAAGGGILALYLTGLNFSISSAIGFVSLFGVSVMNGILIMTYFNEVKASGIETTAAMFQAASQRMRPMLMTALSACIGLLPAAVSTGIGSQVQRPLATVVVGGMFIGPIILLVVVPALQTLFLDRTGERSPTAAES
jgi:cobalt-zinc-cadmium resistance protein CzcA